MLARSAWFMVSEMRKKSHERIFSFFPHGAA